MNWTQKCFNSGSWLSKRHRGQYGLTHRSRAVSSARKNSTSSADNITAESVARLFAIHAVATSAFFLNWHTSVLSKFALTVRKVSSWGRRFYSLIRHRKRSCRGIVSEQPVWLRRALEVVGYSRALTTSKPSRARDGRNPTWAQTTAAAITNVYIQHTTYTVQLSTWTKVDLRHQFSRITRTTSAKLLSLIRIAKRIYKLQVWFQINTKSLIKSNDKTQFWCIFYEMKIYFSQ